MSNRRLIRAIKSINVYIETPFFDNNDKSRIIDNLIIARKEIKSILKEMEK